MNKIEQDTYAILCEGITLQFSHSTFQDRMAFNLSIDRSEFQGYTIGDIKQVCYELVKQGLAKIDSRVGNWRVKVTTPHEIAEWKKKIK